MDTFDVDTVVVGAGVIGIAIARALAMGGREVWLLERGERFGEESSARNSEVIHAGIYYDPGSLKARLCLRGREQLYAFCEAHGVPCRRCGKLIVATNAAEAESLPTGSTYAHILPLGRRGPCEGQRTFTRLVGGCPDKRTQVG